MKKLFTITVTIVALSAAAFTQQRQLVLETQAARTSSPELVVQEWSDDANEYIEYSRDGKYLLTAGSEEAKLWEVSSGKLIRTFPIGNGTPCLSPDSKYLICEGTGADDDFGLQVVNLNNGNKTEIDEKTGTCSVFSPDGKYLASCRGKNIILYDTRTWQRKITLQYENDIMAFFDDICFSSDGNYIISRARKKNEKGYGAFIIVFSFSIKKAVSVIYPERDDYTIGCIDAHDEIFAVGLHCNENNLFVNIYNIENGKFLNKIDIGVKTRIEDLKFFDKNKLFLVNTTDNLLVWDIAANKKLAASKNKYYEFMDFSPDKKQFAIMDSNKIEIRNSNTGKLEKIIGPNTYDRITYDTKENTLHIFSYLNNHVLAFDSLFNSVEVSQEFYEQCENPAAFDGGVYYRNHKNLQKYDTKDKSVHTIGVLEGLKNYLSSSRTGNTVAYESFGKTANVYDVQSQRELFQIPCASYNIGLQVSPKDSFISVRDDKEIRIFRRNGKEVFKINEVYTYSNVYFSIDEKYCAITLKNENSYTTRILDTKTWKAVREFKGLCLAVSDTNLIAVWEGRSTDIYNLTNGKSVVNISSDNTNYVYFNSTGDRLITQGHFGSPVRCYSVKTGELLASLMADTDGDWVAWTPDGYFNGSESGINKFVHIVDGMKVYPLDQFYETLYRPDIVAARLSGADISTVTETVSLASLVSSGDAPVVQFRNVPQSSSARDVSVEFTVQDTGGGIGAVYISLNGKIIQISDRTRALELVGAASKTSGGKTVTFRHILTLASGENSLVAYATNAAGKIESRHATAKITWKGSTAKPSLYMLAVGVNKYRDKSLWLNYAVPDAASISSMFENAKGNLYEHIEIESLHDEKCTKDGIQAAFDVLSKKVSADDVFVFYISGHGMTHTDGDYYFIPADFRFINSDSVLKDGVSKNFITENLSKIKAQKSLVLLDTCNSGAFISGGQRGMTEKTAIDRLSRATGQAIIAASTDTQSAMEGYNGHGIFTYVLLEALSGKADTNDDSYISLSELGQYVEEYVPNLSYEKWGYEQVPQIELRKQANFPVLGK